MKSSMWLQIFLSRRLGPCLKCNEVIVFERWRFYSRRGPGAGRTKSPHGRDLSTGDFDLAEEHACEALGSPAKPRAGRTS